MTRILITRPLPERVWTSAAESFDIEMRDATTPLDRGELLRSLRDFDGVLPTLGDAYTADIFAEAGDARCRILANFGVGFNHIDAEAAQAAGIAVTNTPGAVTDATADIALTLMLMSCRGAGAGERLVRRGAWEGWHPTQMLGLHMTGKHVGIVGMGRIGQAIARRCHFGFGMKVSYFNRSQKSVGVPATSVEDLATLAAQVDLLVAAVPGGPETHHLIDATILASMQPQARLINISRGDVVDEVALIDALQRKCIGGAGLDVYEHEPHVPEALRALETVVLLPHLGTAALEVREEMGQIAVDNLRAFFAGRIPPNTV